MMRAAWFERVGPASSVLTVGEMPIPEPGDGEVRVKIAVSAVNPGDTKKRNGKFGSTMPFPRIVPNSDGAGVIDAIGDFVPSVSVGDRVWVFNAQSGRPFGTAAEYCVVPVDCVDVLPGSIDFSTGAGLGIPARTAHRAVYAGGSVEGKTVLVTGGGGSVASFAIQFAKFDGARVMATVSTKEQEQIARKSGADLIVSYKRQDVSAEALAWTEGKGVDHIIDVDFASNLAVSLRALRVGGSIATYATSVPTVPLPFWDMVFAAATVTFVGVDSDPRRQREALTDIRRALRANLLQPNIGWRGSLDQIAAANDAVDRGVFGKVFLDIAR